MRLVFAAKDSSQHSSDILFTAIHILTIRPCECRGIEGDSRFPRPTQEIRPEPTMRYKTFGVSRMCQHLHALHVLDQFRLRRRRFQGRSANVRRNILGNQSRVRSGFSTVAVAGLLRAHEEAGQLVQLDTTLHPRQDHRRT